LSKHERVETRFREFYVAPRERHDDFAGQIDDVGIGATRHRAASLRVSQAGILYVTT
jgi:hypothetical protein